MDKSFKIMVQTNGKNHHYLMGGDGEDSSNELAKDLVERDMDSATALYQSLGAHLQDKDIRENYDELDLKQALN